MVSGPQVLLLSLVGESHEPYLRVIQMQQENGVIADEHYPAGHDSHRRFLQGDCNFSVEILYFFFVVVPLRL